MARPLRDKPDMTPGEVRATPSGPRSKAGKASLAVEELLPVAGLPPMPTKKMSTEEIIEGGLEWIANGHPLSEYCNGSAVSLSEFKRIIWSSEELRKRYQIATEMQADSYVEDMVRMADRVPDPVRARVMMDARLKAAALLNPRKYGGQGGEEVKVQITLKSF